MKKQSIQKKLKQIKNRKDVQLSTKKEELIFDTVFYSTMLVVFQVLHDKYGFGTKRLNDFRRETNFQLCCIRDSYVSFQDLDVSLQKETAINYLDNWTVFDTREKNI